MHAVFVLLEGSEIISIVSEAIGRMEVLRSQGILPTSLWALKGTKEGNAAQAVASPSL